jgi:hypothetical protein
MTFSKTAIAAMLIGLMIASCNNSKTSEINSQELPKDTTSNNMITKPQSYIAMFEIPALDISRAINFYQSILDIKIERMDVPGMEMGILPYEGQLITGVIIKGDGYKPSADGVTIYLNGGDNLQIILDKVEKSGGKIIAPKTAHADGSGFFAIFLDSEGNKLALNSPN